MTGKPAVHLFAVLVGLVLAATSAQAGGNDAAKKAKICDKAAARYAELFPNPPDDGKAVVLMHKYTFCPETVTVPVGATVRWINVDKRTSHSVWLKEAGVEESERLFGEEAWEFTFASAGTYPYLCGPHWEKEGMIGTVEVQP